MFKKLIIVMLLCLVGAAKASLEGEWQGQEFIKETVKIRNIALPMFMTGVNTVNFNYADNTVAVSNGLGTFHGTFTGKIKVKYGLVIGHSFKIKLDRAELALVVYQGLSDAFGVGFIVSNVKISTASAKGYEFNEFSGEDIFEQEHALHGSYKIAAKFKIAESANPDYKLSASMILDVDFGEFRPENNAEPQLTFPQTSTSLFEESAKRLKVLFEKKAKR